MSGINPSIMDRSRDDVEVTSRVVDAIAELDDIESVPTPRHVEMFESVHEVLSQTLSAVDET